MEENITLPFVGAKLYLWDNCGGSHCVSFDETPSDESIQEAIGERIKDNTLKSGKQLKNDIAKKVEFLRLRFAVCRISW